MYTFLQRCMFMPHSFREGIFLFQYPQWTLSNLCSVCQGFGVQNGTSPPFQLLSHCLPTLLRQNPSTSVSTFSSSVVFGDFYKGLFYLGLSETSTYFVAVHAASVTRGQNPACGLSLGQGDQL